MTTLLPISNLLDSLSETDKLVHVSENYIQIDSLPRLGSELCKLLAEHGYWETHDFGIFSEVSDSFKHDKTAYVFNAQDNSSEYCSNLLSFYENRERHFFTKKEVSTSLFLKIENTHIVGVGLLKRVPPKPKRININSDTYVNTRFLGYMEFYVPTILRKLGHGSTLARYINSRLISSIDNDIPVVGAVGRALPLLTHHLICPVSPRDITHSSYTDDVSLKLMAKYQEISEVVAFPLFNKDTAHYSSLNN